MKKFGLVIALVVAVGLVCSAFAEPASAFFGGGGFGKFFAGAKGGSCGYNYGVMPYYGWAGYYPAYKCKPWKKGVKKMKKAK